MNVLIEQLESCGVIPVIQIDRVDDALPLAEALIEGGLPCAEITFRTPCAAQAIRQISAHYPQMLLGAGTVLTPEQADEAADAGAHFIVSPGLNESTVRHCLQRGYAVIPGVCTPSDIERGLSLGLSYLKFFPAQAAGGVAMLKAMSAPYGRIRFMPTGGIGQDQLEEYLTKPFVFACGGSYIAPSADIAAGRFDKIKQTARQSVLAVEEIRRNDAGRNK